MTRCFHMALWTALLSTLSLPAQADPPLPPDLGVDEVTSEEVATASAASDKKRRQDLETGLNKARLEVEDASRFWPVFTISVGLAAMVGGVVFGFHEAYQCSETCPASGWVGAMVLAGGATITGGMIWLHWTDAGAATAENKRDRLERQLQHLQYSMAAPRRTPTVMSLRF